MLVLAVVSIAGCYPPPITGPVTVPDTPEAQRCAKDCDKRHARCTNDCAINAGLMAEPEAKPVCDGHCDHDRQRCYLDCPGATEGKAP